MKTDLKGCSTCQPGEEHFEEYENDGVLFIQYDYRTPSGELFSCIGRSLEGCRARRDKWIQDIVDPYNRL